MNIYVRLVVVACLPGWSAAPAPAQPSTPMVTDVFNLASGLLRVSPGSFAVILGDQLAGASANCATSQGLPRDWCADIQVALSDGARQYLAALSTVSPTTLVAQMPVELTAGTYALRVTRRAGAQFSYTPWLGIALDAYAPGIYTLDMSGTGLGQFLNQANQRITQSSPANPGDSISVFAAGLGPTSPVVPTGQPTAAGQPPALATIPKVWVAGREATVRYGVLIPGQVGMYQVGFAVPANTPGGEQPVYLQTMGWNSNTVLLPVGGLRRPAINWVVNSANDGPGLVSGSWMTVHGTNLSTTTRSWAAADFVGNKLPTVLDGVSVTVNGKPAAIAYISPTQINAQVPTDNTLGTVAVDVQNSMGLDRREATLQSFSPAFFVFYGVGQSKYLAGVHTDGVYLGPRDLFQGALPTRPARVGDTVMLFGNAFGATSPAVPAGEVFYGAAPLADPAKLTIRIGGMPARVLFAGLAATGLYQFNVVVPRVPAGDHLVEAEIGGLVSQPNKFIAIE